MYLWFRRNTKEKRIFNGDKLKKEKNNFKYINQIPDLLLDDEGKLVAKLYRFECKFIVRVKALNLEQAKEHLENGFYSDWKLIEVE